MTRASALLGLMLGLVSVVGGILGYVRAESSASLIAGGAAGIVLIVAAALTLRGNRIGHLVLLVAAFALLGRFVPAYFLAPQVWPSLVMVALSTLTFGLGVLGFVLDRYRGKPR